MVSQTVFDASRSLTQPRIAPLASLNRFPDMTGASYHDTKRVFDMVGGFKLVGGLLSHGERVSACD